MVMAKSNDEIHQEVRSELVEVVRAAMDAPLGRGFSEKVKERIGYLLHMCEAYERGEDLTLAKLSYVPAVIDWKNDWKLEVQSLTNRIFKVLSAQEVMAK